MDKNILAINLGSSSKKYALFAGDTRLFMAHFEKMESGFAATYNDGIREEINVATYNNALSQVIGYAREKHGAEISTVGIRVVAIGKEFGRHAIIDTQYLEALSKEAERDPAHIPLVVAELADLNRILPGIPVIAASDSAFHSTMPAVARRYAI